MTTTRLPAPAAAARPPVPEQPGGRRPPGSPGTFRPDIEGLRAIAVLLVVLGHAGVPGFTGGYVGVDVFFVISGFLITSVLLREARATGRISIGRFYARRAVRLLPASTLVLAVTLLGSWWWLSPLRTVEYAKDAVAAAFSAINIRLAVVGTDYLASDETPSPLQHFWSLAVEEQFYAVWPMLLLAAFALRRRRAVVVALAAVVVLSFAASVWQTGVSAPWAYFGAHTRAWELGAGALLALAAVPLRRLPVPVAAASGWAGLAAVGYAATRFDGATAFPGWLAVLPVGGAVAIIAAGAAGSRGGVPALLSLRPLQWIGKLSYGWYLWHWPVLMIAPTALGIDAGGGTRLALCAAALVLAWATFRLVEDPLRHRRSLRERPVRGAGLGLGLSVAVAAAAVAVASVPRPVPAGHDSADLRVAIDRAVARHDDPVTVLTDRIRAAATTPVIPANLKPALTGAGHDTPQVYADKCHVESDVVRTPGQCAYGNAGAATTVVLFGDSHAAQWFPALHRLAGERDWKLVSLTKSSCTAADAPILHDSLKRSYTECTAWYRDTVARIGRLGPALVVVASSFAYDLTDPGAGEWQAAWDRTVGTLRATGAAVTIMADTPYMGRRVPACLSRWAAEITRCARSRRTALYGPEQRAIVLGYRGRPDVTVIDPTPWMCGGTCPPVLGNTLVYRDSNHITTVFATAVAPLLGARLPRV